MANSEGGGPKDRAVVAAVSLVILAWASPVSGQAPALSAPWRFSAEVGATGGGVWLEGDRVPRVSTGIGFTFATAARRALTGTTGAAATLRVNVQPVDLRENGVEWTGGTLAQYDVLGSIDVRVPSPASLRASVEAGIGAALLTGADAVVPFRNSQGIAPMAEVGLAIMRASSSRQDVALVARYGVVRVSAEGTDGGTTGWVGRVSAGARITR